MFVCLFIKAACLPHIHTHPTNPHLNTLTLWNLSHPLIHTPNTLTMTSCHPRGSHKVKGWTMSWPIHALWPTPLQSELNESQRCHTGIFPQHRGGKEESIHGKPAQSGSGRMTVGVEGWKMTDLTHLLSQDPFSAFYSKAVKFCRF